MNKKQRVMAVINGQKPDRVPSGYWYHFTPDCKYGEKAVKAHVDFFESSQTDLCKVMNDNLCPNNPEVNGPDDWIKLQPYTMEEDFVKKQLDLIREVKKQVGDEVVLLATVHAVVACCYHILGGGDYYDGDKYALGRHLRANPESMEHGFKIAADFVKRFCKLCLEAGADGIYFASLGGERNMFSDEEFEKYIAPLEIDILNSIQDVPCFNVLHMCKDDLNLARYKNYPAKVLNWGVYENNISLVEGRDLFGADKIYLGGLDDRDGALPNGSLEDIEDAVKDVLKTFGTQNLILGADCTLPTDLSSERIATAVNAAAKI